jgi:hypothetical protein
MELARITDHISVIQSLVLTQRAYTGFYMFHLEKSI